VWTLDPKLFELAAAALDADAEDGIVLEPSVFAWALRRVGGGGGRGGNGVEGVGENFALPHRDYSAKEAWVVGEGWGRRVLYTGSRTTAFAW
jgi:hypothetical protein